jgi:HlyD family secretion protein
MTSQQPKSIVDRLTAWRHEAGGPPPEGADASPAQTYGMDRRIQKKRWTPKRIAWASAAGLFFAVVIYHFLFGDHSSRLNVDPERITISTVERGPFQEFIPVNGTVLPLKTFYLDAVEGGRVEKVFVEAGSVVNKGDPILKLTNAYLQLDAMNREAQLFDQMNNLRNTRLAMEQNRLHLRTQIVELEYQLQQKRRAYERNAELAKRNLISRQEYEDAKDEYDYLRNRRELTLETQKQDSLLRQVQLERLEAAVKRMEASLEMVKQNVENLVVRAPISGQLTSLNAEIGQSKSPKESIGQIDVLEGFKVRAQIDEHYITRITPGLGGEFDLAGKSYRLIVKKVYPEVRQGSFEVDLEFSGEEPKDIRRGQTLQVRLELGDLSEAILLPRGGFYQKTGGNWVFILDRAGEVAVKRQIRLGRQNPQVFEVLEGLAPGERAITSSYDNFGDIDKLILKK